MGVCLAAWLPELALAGSRVAEAAMPNNSSATNVELRYIFGILVHFQCWKSKKHKCAFSLLRRTKTSTPLHNLY